MWGYYKDIYPATHLYLYCSLRILPKSGTKRAFYGLKNASVSPGHKMRSLSAALLWSTVLGFCINHSFLKTANT